MCYEYFTQIEIILTAAIWSYQRYLVIVCLEFSFPEEYGTIIQMQSVIFVISTTSGDMLPLIIHHQLHFYEKKKQDYSVVEIPLH